MFDTRKNNPNCDFAEEVVSYLYEEMNHTEKANFENHLKDCLNCSEELVAFTSVSSTVKEWRASTFDSLATPEIEIPYEQKEAVQTTVETNNASWIEKLREMFSLSPVFMKTATGFAALAVVVGLGWFVLNSFSNKNEEIARENPKTVNSNVEKESEKQKLVKDNSVDSTTKEAPKQEVAINTPSPNPPKPTKPIRRNTATKVSHKPSKRTKVAKKPTRKPKSNKKKTNVTPKLQDNLLTEQTPRLSEDFAVDTTEDEELRLSDLFDELGSDD